MKNRNLLVLTLSVVLMAASFLIGATAVSADTPGPLTPTAGPSSTVGPPVSTVTAPTPTATDPLEGVFVTRAPEPTATPGRLQEQVQELAESVGVAGTTFLGFSIVDWANLVVSLLWVVAGYLLGTWLIRYLLPLVAGRTRTEFDDRLLESVGPDVRRLVVVVTLHVATARLTFVSANVKSFLGDVYFVVGLILTLRIIFKGIEQADDWARQRMDVEGRGRGVERVTVLLTRTAQVATAVLALIMLLGHFGIDVSALTAALGLGGVAITLAAQDTIADAIAGVIILIDRPFHVGDRIEIQGAGTWGDVIDIGLRSTRIQTRDNRVIIVPNSIVGNTQVMNYSYPDPRVRSETDLCVGYGSDLEEARRLIIDTIKGVDGVLDYRPVDALYVEMAPSGALFRARWWIRSYQETRRNLDQVHTALQAAFDQAGISFAPKTQSVKLRADAGTVRRVSAAFRHRGGEGPGGGDND